MKHIISIRYNGFKWNVIYDVHKLVYKMQNLVTDF